MLRIKLVKSLIGNNKRNRSIVAALGLRKMHHTVDHRDTPQIRGMIHRVKHMLEVSEIGEAEAKPRTTGTPQRARTNPEIPGMPGKRKFKAKKVRPMPPQKAPRPKVKTIGIGAGVATEEPVAKPKPKPAPKPKAEEPKAAKPKAEAKPKAAAKPKAEAAKPKAEKKPKAKKEEQ